MIIPESVEKQFRYLCTKLPNIEWSGVLFYETIGSWKDKTLTIVCKDIYVMDIGNSTYTEFDIAPEVISYMVDNELTACKSGLFHSHNVMATFFSSTDLGTLKEEGSKRNHFVSLIVNNAGEYTAAITRKVSCKKEIKSINTFSTFEDETVVESPDVSEEITEEIQYCMLDIDKATIPNVFSSIDERLNEIKKSKSTYHPNIINSNTTVEYPKYNYLSQEYTPTFETKTYRQGNLFEDVKQENVESTLSENQVKGLVLQLLTGCVTMSHLSKLDAKSLANDKMVSMFDARFKDIENFKDWANGFCEYLVFFTPDSNGEDMSVNEGSFKVACALYEALSELPQNKYIKEYLEILETWMID